MSTTEKIEVMEVRNERPDPLYTNIFNVVECDGAIDPDDIRKLLANFPIGFKVSRQTETGIWIDDGHVEVLVCQGTIYIFPPAGMTIRRTYAGVDQRLYFSLIGDLLDHTGRGNVRSCAHLYPKDFDIQCEFGDLNIDIHSLPRHTTVSLT